MLNMELVGSLIFLWWIIIQNKEIETTSLYNLLHLTLFCLFITQNTMHAIMSPGNIWDAAISILKVVSWCADSEKCCWRKLNQNMSACHSKEDSISNDMALELFVDSWVTSCQLCFSSIAHKIKTKQSLKGANEALLQAAVARDRCGQ